MNVFDVIPAKAGIQRLSFAREKSESLGARLRGHDGSWRFASIAALTLALTSCATMNHVSGDVRPFAPTANYAAVGAPGTPSTPAQAVPAQAAPSTAGDGGGSIYASAGSNSMRLFEDNKARAVGDLLTVVLVENTAARTNAKTAVDKNNSIGMAAPTVFGTSVTYNGKNLLEAQVDAARKFAGAGDSSQSNQLNGQITVRVVQDLGHGNLLVRGDKQMRLNQGDELVQIQGIVRVADIGPDNRITSDRVGDPQIVYGGRGTLARSNAMGWLGRFFNSALFPY